MPLTLTLIFLAFPTWSEPPASMTEAKERAAIRDECFKVSKEIEAQMKEILERRKGTVPPRTARGR